MGELERGMRDMTVGDTKAGDKLKQTKAQKKRARKIATVVNYFDTNYGTDDTNLAKWQGLCEDVGVAAGNSILECKKVGSPRYRCPHTLALTRSTRTCAASSSTSSNMCGPSSRASPSVASALAKS